MARRKNDTALRDTRDGTRVALAHAVCLTTTLRDVYVHRRCFRVTLRRPLHMPAGGAQYQQRHLFCVSLTASGTLSHLSLPRLLPRRSPALRLSLHLDHSSRHLTQQNVDTNSSGRANLSLFFRPSPVSAAWHNVARARLLAHDENRQRHCLRLNTQATHTRLLRQTANVTGTTNTRCSCGGI